MRKYNLYLSALSLSAFCLMFSSCKDDDEPAAKPQLSFASTTLTVKESDGTVEVQVVLDKAASEDITIEYSLSGTALDDITAGTSAPSDYEVLSEYGEVEIAAGETTGIIELDIYSDSDYEDDETIEISIEDVSSDEIEITRDDEIEITLQQEDGLVVLLEWGVGDGETYTDVDMDLFLWAENTSSDLAVTDYVGLSGSYYTSLQVSFTSPEYFFLPTAIVEDGTFGLSCTYYEGTADPMNFEVSFIEIVNNDDVSTVTKKGTYTLANINKWDDETTGTEPVMIITFKKAGTDFTDFGEITVPGTGSRMGSGSKFPEDFKRRNTPVVPSEKMKTYLKLNKN